MRLITPLVLLLTASGLSAQETRTAAADAVSPPATLEQIAFITGRWQGSGIEGRAATESWLPATGNTMVGTFVQADAGDGIMFTEHMYMVEEAGSLVMRLKHFNPDLTGWEAQGDVVSFPLLEIEPCAAYFRALTMRCDGPNGLLIAVLIHNADGNAGELVFRFTRAG